MKFLSGLFSLPCFIVFSIGGNNNIKLKPEDFIVKSIKGIMLTSLFHWPHFVVLSEGNNTTNKSFLFRALSI